MTDRLPKSWFYQNVHTGNVGDAEFYRAQLGPEDSVLELGGGHGRLARLLAPEVKRYVVVEADPDLAERCAKELRGRVETIRLDMRELVLESTFSRVLLAYNTLYCLGGKSGVTALLERLRAVLLPGGELYIDAYSIEAYHEALLSGEAPRDPEPPEVRLEVTTSEGKIDVYEETRVYPEEQRLWVRYEARRGTEILGEEVILHDYLLTHELAALLESAGFEVVDAFGDFDGTPFDEDSEHWIVRCRLRRTSDA